VDNSILLSGKFPVSKAYAIVRQTVATAARRNGAAPEAAEV
jgi:hypothetical protein